MQRTLKYTWGSLVSAGLALVAGAQSAVPAGALPKMATAELRADQPGPIINKNI